MKVTVLEKDLNQSKTDLENSDMVYEKPSCKCDSIFCKNWESLQKKVLYLVKTIDIISKGKSNFENVLASQTCVFGKSGLGFNPQSKQSGFCSVRLTGTSSCATSTVS